MTLVVAFKKARERHLTPGDGACCISVSGSLSHMRAFRGPLKLNDGLGKRLTRTIGSTKPISRLGQRGTISYGRWKLKR